MFSNGEKVSKQKFCNRWLIGGLCSIKLGLVMLQPLEMLDMVSIFQTEGSLKCLFQ